MNINDSALSGFLRSHAIPPVVIVSGDEHLLVEESLGLIHGAIEQQGIEVRERFCVDSQFNVAQLHTALVEPSLFGERKVIDLHVLTKLTPELKTLLVAYAKQPIVEQVLICRMPKLSAAERQAKWVKALEKIGLHVLVWPIKPAQMPAWVITRATRHHLTLDAEAAAFLASRCEGNVLACEQVLIKLALMGKPKTILLDDLIGFIQDEAHYDIFDLSMAFLMGDGSKYIRIIHHLQAEGVSPSMVLWSITNAMRTLIKLHVGMAQKPLSSLFQQHRVFGPNQAAMRRGLAAISLSDAHGVLLRAFEIEKIIKGVEVGDPWLAFEALLMLEPHLGVRG